MEGCFEFHSKSNGFVKKGCIRIKKLRFKKKVPLMPFKN
jgi:hypothetical protein